jgi:hypothetical protein
LRPPVPVSDMTRRVDPHMCGIMVHDMPETSSQLFHAVEVIKGDAVRKRWPTMGGIVPQKFLPVHRAGVYRYSIVPTVHDFVLADDAVFKLDLDSPLHTLLLAHYSHNFAFLVCVIDESARLRPIAYEHDRLASGDFFIPTRHYHPHEAVEGSAAGKTDEKADWDHKIFSIGACGNPRAGQERRIVARPSLHNEKLAPWNLSRTLFDAGVDLPFELPQLDGGGLQMLTITSNDRKNDDIILRCHRATSSASSKRVCKCVPAPTERKLTAYQAASTRPFVSGKKRRRTVEAPSRRVQRVQATIPAYGADSSPGVSVLQLLHIPLDPPSSASAPIR